MSGGIPLLRLYAFIWVSRDGASLSEEAQWRGPRGWSSFTEDHGSYVKKGSGCGHLSP